jgi:hypothetical protein
MKSGLAAKLKKSSLEREKKDDMRRELANEKAEKLRIKEEARMKAEAEAKFLRENEHLRLQMEREKWEAAELIRKTKTYFRVSDYSNEKLSIAMNPTYYGEHTTDKKGDSWIPHGPGEFLVGDEPLKKGTFSKGHMHGEGFQVFDDDSKWEGEFKRGYMDGVGFYTPPPETHPGTAKREALARENMIICYLDELQQGLQIEFDDPTMRVITKSRKPRASIMHHVRNWKFRCHFHDEIKPRERDVVFSSIKMFTILKHLPRIYHTSDFGVQNDPPKRYDYFKDVYGKSEEDVPLGTAGGRRTINMKAHNALPLIPGARYNLTKSDYKENVLESAEVGIGKAKAIEEKKRKEELKNKQFAALIEKRRKDEEAKRKALIEEEQKKIMEEDLAQKKAAFEEKKRQKEQEEKVHQEALEQALQAVNEEHSDA